MSIFAIVNPSSLLGQELRELLDQNRESWAELRLLATDETEVGTLTEIGGGAAMVQKLEDDSLRGVDALFLCGDLASSRKALDKADPGTVCVLLSPDATAEDGSPVVHGVSTEEAFTSERRVFVSPHPGAVLVAHLVAPLRHLGLTAAQATLTIPASTHNREGLDELFDQTRSIIAMAENRPTAIFGRQLAFNLYPETAAPAALAAQLRAILGDPDSGDSIPVAARGIRTGVFHGLSVSLHLQFDADPGAAALRDALADSSAITLSDEEEAPSPIDIPASPDIHVTHPQADGAGGYWLWAVMDNLTRGGAINALGVAQAALGRG